jgi:hypothetical protein
MPVVNTIQVRRDTAANWTSTNPTLASGEAGLETDTGRFKYGNGSSTWTALAYANGGGAIPQSQVTSLTTDLAGKSPLAGSTSITTVGTVTNATSPTAAGSTGLRRITISTSGPSGGADGDVWLRYV